MDVESATGGPQPADSAGTSSSPHRPPAPSLGRELEGDLPCVVCGYNLRGLSIRSMCPECGAGVRATILSLVDPKASELQRIELPRLTATGVVLWPFGAIIVVIMSWLPQTFDALRLAGVWGAHGMMRPSAALGVAIGVSVSGLGSLALIRPHAGIPPAQSVMAALASLLYIPLALVLLKYHEIVDLMGGQHYLSGWRPDPSACRALGAAGLLVAAIILLERPNARLLVARSLVLRTGRVDRQTLAAMAISAWLLALGAFLGSLRPGIPADLLRAFAVLLIAIGSLLLTIGVLGSMLDCARIAGAILIPKMTVRQIIREGQRKPGSRLMKVIDPAVPPAADIGGTRPPPSPSGDGA